MITITIEYRVGDRDFSFEADHEDVAYFARRGTLQSVLRAWAIEDLTERLDKGDSLLELVTTEDGASKEAASIKDARAKNARDQLARELKDEAEDDGA